MHDHMGGMAGMGMGNGIPSLASFQQYYYAIVGAVVAVAAIVNALSFVLYRQRLLAAYRYQQQPAKPKNFFWRAYATVTAISRETFGATTPALSFRRFSIRAPLTGQAMLVLGNLTVLLVFCFYGFDTLEWANYENIGYRTGFVTICQLPLIFLLAGKKNIIGCLTGFSYEKLNWLHRWTARCMWLTSTIHFAYWLADWWQFEGFVKQKLTTDPVTYRGLIAWCILGWVNLSSSTPVRGWNYEFFIVQHVVSFSVMVGFIWWHVPSENWVWIWIVSALFWFDRVVRGLNVLYNNLSIFHWRQKRNGDMNLWASKADITLLPQDSVKITINDPPVSWRPGQHFFLSCHSVVPLQSHPFTAASLPSDGKLEFIVKAHTGGTRRLFRHSEKLAALPTTAEGSRIRQRSAIALEGPYGSLRPLRQFDSVVLFAGSTGATFIVPLLRDLVEAWRVSPNPARSVLHAPAVAVTRHIRLVWCVRSKAQIGWFATQLNAVADEVEYLRKQGRDVEVELSVYCTCTDEYGRDVLPRRKQLPSWLWWPWRRAASRQAQEDTADGEKTNAPALGRVSVTEGDEVDEHDSTTALSPSAAQMSFSPVVLVPPDKSTKNTVQERRLSLSRSDSSVAKSSSSASSVQQDEITQIVKNEQSSCCCSPGGQVARAGTTSCDCGNPITSPPQPDAEKSTAQTTVLHLHSSHQPVTTVPATSTSTIVTTAVPLHPSIPIHPGRPRPRDLMRASLERALGESAVVVCGPQSLISDVRRDYVALCDERAVCKGTGAMGVYFHAEGFGY